MESIYHEHVKDIMKISERSLWIIIVQNIREIDIL